MEIVNTIINQAPNVALYAGYIYLGLIVLRLPLFFIAKITKTERDNKVVNAIYAFLDKYTVSLLPLKNLAEARIKALRNKK